MIQMFVQRFDSGSRPTTVILGKRDKHKSHAGRFLPGSVVDILPFDNFLIGSWQGPVGFDVPHRSFVGTHQKIPIRDIQIDAVCPAPLIERTDPFPLFPLRIQIPFVSAVDGGGTGIARVGTVVLEYVHAGRIEEILQTLEIITAPIRSDTRGKPETTAFFACLCRMSCVMADRSIFRFGSTACQQ